MPEIYQQLEEEIAGYQGPHAEFIRHAPSLYRLMVGLLQDPALHGRLRPLLLAAVAYFVLQGDLVPEDLRGPEGYADDVFLAGFVAGVVRRELGSDEALLRNWEGDANLLELLAQIDQAQGALIGDRLDLLLWYIGYEYYTTS